MFKKNTRLLLIALFSLILIDTSVFAFHKINSEDQRTVYESPELEREKVKQKYCAWKNKKKRRKVAQNKQVTKKVN